MAITIPETMPEDWFGEAEMDRGGFANDPALRQAMDTAYQDGLEAMGVNGIMGRLKDRCMAAAKPQETSGAETVTNPAEEVSNHHLTPESVEAGSDAT